MHREIRRTKDYIKSNGTNNMATNQKKRAVVSYEKMSKELAAAFVEKYPKGFSDYLPDLIKYDKPDGTCFYAVTVEVSGCYLSCEDQDQD